MNENHLSILRKIETKQWACLMKNVSKSSSDDIWKIISTIDDIDHGDMTHVSGFMEELNYYINEL